MQKIMDLMNVPEHERGVCGFCFGLVAGVILMFVLGLMVL
jgi:hypothetical protein